MKCPVQSRAAARAGRGSAAACFALLSVVAALWSPGGALAAPAPQPAASADAALDAVGINTKFTDTEVEHCALVPVLRRALRDLRVRHVRDAATTWDRANTTCTWVEHDRLQTARGRELLASLAPRVQTLLTISTLNRVTQAQLLSGEELRRRISREGPDNDVLDVAEWLAAQGALEGIEHTNELDLGLLRSFKIGRQHIHPWLSQLRNNQMTIHAYARAADRPLLAGMPIIGPSFGRELSYAAYANGFDATAYQDTGNLHFYANGFMPEASPEYPGGELNEAVAAARAAAPGQPLVVTEAGYHTAPNARNGDGVLTGASEHAAAVYLPRMLLGLKNEDVARTYLFELRDHRDFGPADQESYFGLLRWDGTRRPAFGAMARLLGALEDPGPAHTPDPLAYELTDDAGGEVRTRLFGRRDGSYVLAVWRAVPVWDPLTQELLPVTPRRVGVVLGEPDRYVATVARLQDGGPSGPIQWRAARRAAGPIQLDLAGDVQLVRLSPR